MRDNNWGFGGLGKLYLYWLDLHSNSIAIASRRGPCEEDEKIMQKLNSPSFCLKVNLEFSEDFSVAVAWSCLLIQIECVLHLAGALSDKLFQFMSWIDFKSVFKGKICGLHSLWKKLSGEKIKWILFSSTSSSLGNIGQANYSSANGFLDGFAKFATARKIDVISINWGPWGLGIYKSVEQENTGLEFQHQIQIQFWKRCCN